MRDLCLHTYASGLRVQVRACMHRPRVSMAFYFPKIIYFLIKSYIFYFNTSQVNL